MVFYTTISVRDLNESEDSTEKTYTMYMICYIHVIHIFTYAHTHIYIYIYIKIIICDGDISFSMTADLPDPAASFGGPLASGGPWELELFVRKVPDMVISTTRKIYRK